MMLHHLAVQQTNLGLVDIRRSLPNPMHSDNCSMLPTLWQQCGKGPFLFQHDNTTVQKAPCIKKLFAEISVGELDRPEQSPELKPIEHLWDELEYRLCARTNQPTSMPEPTNIYSAS